MGMAKKDYKEIPNRVIRKLKCEGANKSWFLNTLSGGAGYELWGRQ